MRNILKILKHEQFSLNSNCLLWLNSIFIEKIKWIENSNKPKLGRNPSTGSIINNQSKVVDEMNRMWIVTSLGGKVPKTIQK